MSHPADKLRALLGLRWAPVAVAFRAVPPEGVARVERPAPSGCTYWQRAAEGAVFFTEASDHYNCPVGSYTHNVALPADRAAELKQMIGTMLDLHYLRESEIPSIPTRGAPFQTATYGPWSSFPCDPDVVILRGNARQLMLLAEAAGAAGVPDAGQWMGRPTCAMIPAALEGARGALSLGCIGNRVYTELGDDEAYGALPAAAAARVVDQLATIVEANRTLEAFHRERKESLR